ncbi:MAG: hypothetical protein IJC37_08070 [Clostridia bacterium]|nr:hypothetical protein [Clostridia bacterium]
MSEIITSENTTETNKKKNKRISAIIAIAVAVVAVVVAAVCLFSSGSTKTIDVTEYLQIDVSGFDGYAIAKGSILHSDAVDAIREVINEKYGKDLEKAEEKADIYYELDMDSRAEKNYEKYSELYDKVYEEYDALLEGLDAMELTLNKSEYVANGDELELTVSLDAQAKEALKEYGYELKADKITLTVEGLKTGYAIDPFKYIDVVFEGVSGFVKATVKPKADLNEKLESFIITSDDRRLYVNYSEAEQSEINFNVSSTTDLKNGEKVTVSAYSNDLKENTILAQSEKEYTILVPEAFKTAEEVKKNLGSIYSLHIEDSSYVTSQGCYILTAANDDAKYSNKVVAVFKYESTGWFSSKYYYIAEIDNCYRDTTNKINSVKITKNYGWYETVEEAFAAAEELIDTNYYTYVKG